jgi:hypothetical protein
MACLKRKSIDITVNPTYPCSSLPDDVLHYILSFLQNKDFVSLKVLSKECNEKFDGPYYWRMMTLHMLHDKARGRTPSMKSVSEEEIDGWDTERLLDECKKYNIQLSSDKPDEFVIGSERIRLTPAQIDLIPSYTKCPAILRKALKQTKLSEQCFGPRLSSCHRDYPASLLSLEGVSESSPLWKLAAIAVHKRAMIKFDRTGSGTAFGDFLNFAVDNEALRDVPHSAYDASTSVDARKLLHHTINMMMEEPDVPEVRYVYAFEWRDEGVDNLGAGDPERFFRFDHNSGGPNRLINVVMTSGVAFTSPIIERREDYTRPFTRDFDVVGRDRLKFVLITESLTLGDDVLELQQAERYNFSDRPSFRFGGIECTLRDWKDGDSTLHWGDRLDDGEDEFWIEDAYNHDYQDIHVLPGPNDPTSLSEFLAQNGGEWIVMYGEVYDEVDEADEARTIDVFSVPIFIISLDK